MSSFNEQQLAYIDSKYSPIDKRIRQILIEEPKETLKYVYDQQKKPYKSITQAGERSDLQAKVLKDLDEGKKLKDEFMEAELKKIRTAIKAGEDVIKIIDVKPKTKKDIPTKEQVNTRLKDLENKQKNINDIYNKLPDTARGIIQSDYEKINNEISKRQAVMRQYVSTGKFQSYEELSPTQDINYDGRDRDIALLNEYVVKADKIYGLKVKEAVKNIFGLSFFDYLSTRSKIDKKTIIREELGNLGTESPQEFNKRFSQYKQADYSPFQEGAGQDTREGFEAQKQKDLAEAKRQADLANGHDWMFAKD